MKRKHQREFETVIDGIIRGSGINTILCNVTPGGGKSALPIIAGRLIAAGLADKILWICPRTNLQDQGARGFVDPFFRNEFKHRLTIRSSTNENDPCRGLDGFITTYQAIGVDDAQTVLREVKSRRYIVILDEPHHVETGGLWAKALQPIMDAAAFRVLMTGTLERGDGKTVAFIKYKKGINDYGVSGFLPNVSAPGLAYIQYSRTDALQEQAIIPLKFFCHDGHAKWKDREGRERSTKSLARTYGYDTAPAIWTAIHTDFAIELLEKALAHWQKHRRRNPRAKLLIVCAGIESARKMAEHLKRRGIPSDIATSHETAEARAAIKKFKKDLPCLVTIAMAYEGMDVPAITHTAALTHIRSMPWLEQMFGRSTRFDRFAGPYESQCAYVFAPDDPLMRDVIERIEAEQEPFATRAASQKKLLGVAEESEGEGRAPVIPIGSGITGEREAMLGPAPLETPDDIEEQLRDEIEAYIRSYAFRNRYNPKRINAEIYQQFGKPRADMTIEELKRALRYCKKTYTGRRGTGITRVPSKAVAWTG